MDAKAFDEFLEERIYDIRSKLKVKGAEYVPGTEVVSRFHNFEVGAALNGESIEKTLWGFVTKHIVSLSDMVKVNSTDYDIAVWDEKIGDVIIYMLLLHGMVTHTHDISKVAAEVLSEEAIIDEVEKGLAELPPIHPDDQDELTTWRTKVTPPRATPQRV